MLYEYSVEMSECKFIEHMTAHMWCIWMFGGPGLKTLCYFLLTTLLIAATTSSRRTDLNYLSPAQLCVIARCTPYHQLVSATLKTSAIVYCWPQGEFVVPCTPSTPSPALRNSTLFLYAFTPWRLRRQTRWPDIIHYRTFVQPRVVQTYQHETYFYLL